MNQHAKYLRIIGWILLGLVILSFSFVFGFVQGQQHAFYEENRSVPFSVPAEVPPPCPFVPEDFTDYYFKNWLDDYLLISSGEEICSLKIVPESQLQNILGTPLSWSDLVEGDWLYFISTLQEDELVAYIVVVGKLNP